MSTLTARSDARHRGLHSTRRRRPAIQHAPKQQPPGTRMERYLPLALLVTALVTILPAVLVATLAPPGGVPVVLASGACAVALSMALASAAAALWKRQPSSRDVLFADLLLWGWLRRWRTERRLSRVRELYDSARNAGPMVSLELLMGLGRLLEARDSYTHGHGSRVARHAERIARAMHLSPTEIARIRTAAAVHDLGKLYTPREILNNPGRLTPAEFDVIKRHAADGADMLEGTAGAEIAAMVRHHHERMDGNGYPGGLAGAEIPLGARIIAVADTFDAITSSRAYRTAGTQKKALEVISNGAGSQLDPAAVAAFRHRYSGRRSVVWLAIATAVFERAVIALQAASGGVAAGGVSSILPALGAAGLFSLSPALNHGAGAVSSRHPTPARVQSSVRAATPAAHAPLAHRRTSTATHRATGRPVGHGRPLARIAPVTRTGGHRVVRVGSGTPHPNAGGHVPAATPVPAASGPDRPPTPPPVRVPPVEPAPPPTGPVSPPVTVPGVTVPPVTVPQVTVPPVTIPPVTTPSVTVTLGG